MKAKDFCLTIFNARIWINILAICVIIALLVVGAHFGMNIYTHHGEAIAVPDVRKHSYEDAMDMLDDANLEGIVTDTVYIKKLPPGIILEQLPLPGVRVKSGRIVYLTINATSMPTMALPDIIDNSSVREAKARLLSMGFKLGEIEEVPGEKDWVYGVKVNGKNVATGQQIPIEAMIVIQVGNGLRNAADSVYMTDRPEEYYEEDYESMEDANNSDLEGMSDEDDFQVIE